MGRTSHRVGLTGVMALALVLSSAVASGGWMHTGGDPARTNSSPERGPTRDDVAFAVDLGEEVVTTPLIVGDRAIVGTNPSNQAGESAGRLWQIDLGTAKVEPLATTSQIPGDLVTDGETLFVAFRTIAVVRLSSAYPKAGEDVRLDLSATSPGVHGPATSFAVDWGDGSASPAASTRAFEHAYVHNGTYVATVHVANDAGQTSSAEVVFGVGQLDPLEAQRLALELQRLKQNNTQLQNDLDAQKLNPLQVAFAPEHQNLTFFLLGLAVSSVGVLFGVLRVRRRRRLLERELSAVRTAHAGAAGHLEREQALDEHRARARMLLQDGKLDHAQFVILTGTIDEMEGRTRSTGVKLDLGFLPKRLRAEVQRMLADGRIRPGELSSFDALLADERTLSAAARARAHEVVSRWSARDAMR